MPKKLNEIIMPKELNKALLFLGGLSFLLINFATPLLAQKDSTGRGVDILSSFRPSIRSAAKVDFSPGSVSPDTSRPELSYKVPNQQLPLGYTITSLRPLAYSYDSVLTFTAHPYLKVGYGNLRTPFLQGSYAWGDGYTKGVLASASHISSKGKIEHQRYSSSTASLGGFKRWDPTSLRGEGKISMAIDHINKYGYQFANPVPLITPVDDSIKQRFTTLQVQGGISSTKPSVLGVAYSAQVELSYFRDRGGNAETGFRLQAPVQKYLGENWRVDLTLTADGSRLLLKDNFSLVNNMASLSPTIHHWNQRFSFQAGLRPTWDPQGFRLLPVLSASVLSTDKKWMLQLGWEGQLEKTSYRSLTSTNPWLWAPGKLLNTSIDEKYLGVKATIGNHFYLNAKSGYAVIRDMPLFVNDSTALGDGKSFQVVYEERIRRLQLKGEVGYLVAERFQAGASIVINQFTGLVSQPHVWGALPMEFNANLKVNILKDLLVKADLFAWRGARYRLKEGTDKRLSGAFDLNAGLEFKLTQSLRLWAQFNNLLNNTYQRWNQYPVYGFNCTAGVVFSPRQKNKN